MLNEAMKMSQNSSSNTIGSVMEWVDVRGVFCVTKLFTPPESRRLGGASSLISGIKHSPIYLQAHTDGSIDNKVLVGFYENLGFQHLGKGYMFREDCYGG